MCLPSLFILTPVKQRHMDVSRHLVYTHTWHTAPNGGVSPASLSPHQAHRTDSGCLPMLFILISSTQHQMVVPPQPVYTHTCHTAPMEVSLQPIFSHTQHTAWNAGVSPVCLYPHLAHLTKCKWLCLPSLLITTPSRHHEKELSLQPVYSHSQSIAPHGHVSRACLFTHLAHT